MFIVVDVLSRNLHHADMLGTSGFQVWHPKHLAILSLYCAFRVSPFGGEGKGGQELAVQFVLYNHTAMIALHFHTVFNNY